MDYRAARDEFQRKWPKYHRDCMAWGIFEIAKGAVQLKQCSCLDAMECPRCRGLLQAGYTCPACGWNIDDKNRGVPDQMVG